MTKSVAIVASAGLLVGAACAPSSTQDRSSASPSNTGDSVISATTVPRTATTLSPAPGTTITSTIETTTVPASTLEPSPSTDPLVSFAPIGRPASRTAGDLQASLDTVLSNTTFDSIASAHFAPGPAGARGQWLYVDVNVPSIEDGQATRAQWEANALFGAVAERSATGPSLADALGGVTVVHLLPDGSSQEDSYGIGEMAAGQSFESNTIEDDALVDHATNVLTGFDLAPVSVDVVRPLDGALAVTATISSPDSFNSRLYELIAALTNDYIRYEAYYVELQLPDGQPIAKVGGAVRVGVGIQWVQPGFEVDLGTRPPPPGT